MKKLSIVLILINLLLLAGYFIYAVNTKEQILKNGKLVLLKLAPVDPRSLMQGDYMVLNYEINQKTPDNAPQKGYVMLSKNESGDYKATKFQNYLPKDTLSGIPVEYIKVNNWNQRIRIGAESYFFQEGNAEKFENAVYGGLKIDANGNSVLIGLYDENKKLIE